MNKKCAKYQIHFRASATLSNPLRTAYSRLNVSVRASDGKVFLYDVLSELVRVLAVRKARRRGSVEGLFFQSRMAVAHLNKVDPIVHRKLERKWFVRA